MSAVFTMDEETTTPDPATRGLSDDEIIATYIKLDRRVKEAASERQWYASALAVKAAQERRSEIKTVHLENSTCSQKIKATFSSDWTVTDDEQIAEVKNLLGDERFNELFKIQYVPKVQKLKTFLNTGSTDERVKVAKEIVEQVVKEVPKLNPTLSVEKS